MFAVAAMGVAGGVIAVADEPKATGVVAVRQATMKANGAHMAAIKSILTEYPQALDQIQGHAQALLADSADAASLFPAGSDQPASWALPAVWSDQAGFKAAAAKNQELAGKLVEVSKGGDAKAILAAFGTLGKEGCGGCHQTFRKKDS
ncbi:MAG: cytochrome c [Geminicoccaceae bacterium]